MRTAQSFAYSHTQLHDFTKIKHIFGKSWSEVEFVCSISVFHYFVFFDIILWAAQYSLSTMHFTAVVKLYESNRIGCIEWNVSMVDGLISFVHVHVNNIQFSKQTNLHRNAT